MLRNLFFTHFEKKKVNEIGEDEVGVDEMEVDEMGSRRSGNKSHKMHFRLRCSSNQSELVSQTMCMRSALLVTLSSISTVCISVLYFQIVCKILKTLFSDIISNIQLLVSEESNIKIYWYMKGVIDRREAEVNNTFNTPINLVII